MSKDFAQRIRERYPEGLTGVFAIGGTRTTYILEQNRDKADPGKIEDFRAHGEYLLRRYWDLIDTFYDLGGQNMIVTAFSFRGFYNRGEEYARLVADEMFRFIDDDSIDYYKRSGIDPYFTGIDTLLLLPEDSYIHDVGKKLAAFQKSYPYQEGNRKLIWEIASIPLYTFWQTYRDMTPEDNAALDAEIRKLDNLEDVQRVLYRHFSKAAYGTEVPMPHFYLGTNKSGDLKWRSPMPVALTYGDYLRMFYTPYPSLFIQRETLQAILNDLAFKERFMSAKTDYAEQYTSELAQAEYERVMELSSTPETALGYSRRVSQAQRE